MDACYRQKYLLDRYHSAIIIAHEILVKYGEVLWTTSHVARLAWLPST